MQVGQKIKADVDEKKTLHGQDCKVVCCQIGRLWRPLVVTVMATGRLLQIPMDVVK